MSINFCRKLLHPMLVIMMVFCLLSFIGWTGHITEWQHYLTIGTGFLFFSQRWLAYHSLKERKGHEFRRLSVHLTVSLLVLITTSFLIMLDLAQAPYRDGLWHSLVQISIILSGLASIIHHQTRFTAKTYHPGFLLAGSFLAMIILGSLLLKMPRCVVNGGNLGWLDAVFTSTSAICVTGLAVQNTATFFSPTGQMILLILIQIGGLGIMTLTFFAAALLFEGISLHDRLLLGRMIQENRLSRVNQTLVFIILMTFGCELLGALSLFLSSPAHIPLGERLFHSIFHSISAFCNAGFSTFTEGIAGKELAGNIIWQSTLMILIIIGGIGVFVAEDLVQFAHYHYRRIFHPKTVLQRINLRIQTRIVVWTTISLIFGGAFFILISEFLLWNGPENGGKIVTSLFHSITARTAGFNSVGMSSISLITAEILILLMLIGGSPGGTAGGIRTTVFAISIKQLWNQIRNSRRGLTVFHRKITNETGAQALGLFLLSIFWLIINFILLRLFESDSSITDIRLLFELVSAFATVGLSLDLTPLLSDSSKILLIVNMFVGRIGLFTILTTLVPDDKRPTSGKPTETIYLQ